MLIRLFVGFVKGAVIGGAVGYGAFTVGMTGGWNWITYAVIGAVIGLLVGRPLWRHLLDRHSTAVTSLLKALFGAAMCVGLYALVAKVWGGFELTLQGETHNVVDWPFLLGAGLGGVWGAWVEADDAPDPKTEDPARPASGARA